MSSQWPEVVVKEVCESVVDCVNKTAPVVDYITPYRMIRTTNVKNGTVNLEGARYVTQEVYEKWTRRVVPQYGDVILTREAPLGEVGMLKSNEKIFLGQRLMQYRANSEKLNNHFLLYALQESFMQGQIRASGSGSTVEHMRVGDAENLKIKLPHIEVQQKIASILSAYDDLIENNNRRIAILEEMARSLYREWFVKFRFPGHEEVKMIDSELREIPEGWEAKHLENVIDINRGRSYKSSELVEEGGLPFLNLKNIARDGGFRRDGLKWYNGPYKPAQTACANDIIMAVTDMTQERAVIARPARVPNMGFDMFVLSMDLIKITAKLDYDNGFVYCLLRYSQFSDEVKQFANGANVLHLSPTVIEKYQTILPPMELQTKFYTIVQKLHRLQDNLAIKNDNLKTQRDMLLPKLISGKIKAQYNEIYC